MGELSLAMKALGVGPRGGNLNNPVQKRERREAELNIDLTPDGQRTLHRFEKENEVAVQGQKNELPWHRMAAHMIVAGRTNAQVADAAGVTRNCVSNIRCQRWFQELMQTLANEHGEEVLGLLKAEALASVEKLVQLRDECESPKVQLDAARTLLEHANGKPTQRILSVSASTTFSSEQEEMQAIQQELQTLRNKSI